jgi:hypothetical protein
MDTGFMMSPVMLRPKSHGTITLASKDLADPPITDPQFLTLNNDVKILVEGLKIIKSFLPLILVILFGNLFL